MTRKARNLNPLRMYLVAGVSSIALAALVILLATRTVHADARLLGPTVTAPVAAVTSPTPATLARPKLSSRNSASLEKSSLEKKYRLHGVASWYGGLFNGRPTASGEPYNMYAMTACHPTLPFGSLVRVINRRNHRSVVVRITDRGDLVDEHRIIDLSYGAAEKLAMVDRGIAPVDLQVLALGRSGK